MRIKTIFETIERTDDEESVFDRIQAEYDKLCPKPSEFKKRQSTECKYSAYEDRYLFKSNSGNTWGKSMRYEAISLPYGIDWRLCKWTVEDAKRIHGEDK